MRKAIGISLLALAVSVPLNLVAAEDEPKDETYTYATYFYCNAGTQEQADELVKKNTAPVYDAAVADGTIKRWGWMSHHTGGKWRRIQYHQAGSVAELLSAQEEIGKRVDKAMNGADDGFGSICSAHEDYIWKLENGSASDARSNVGISVYQECDFTKEERADEIVNKVFAPIYNKAVADGKIASWGWQSHVIGGKYRRLSTMTAENYDKLLAARDEILGQLYDTGEESEAAEFSKICNSHSDYLWDIVHEK